MLRSLENVVTWKGRTIPGERVIPPHLRLAILSRGWSLFQTQYLEWLIKEAMMKGEVWPDRLLRPLSSIFPVLPTTIELFQNQNPSLIDEDIDLIFRGYLLLRRIRHMKDCQSLPFSWITHDKSAQLGNRLGIDLSELYRRPQVRPEPNNPRQYFLLTYVRIPERVVAYIHPGRPSKGPAPPAVPMPILEGRTSSATEFNLRSDPSLDPNNVLGIQIGHSIPVKVLNKKEADGEYLYCIELSEDLVVSPPPRVLPPQKWTKLEAGKTCWLAAGGIEYVAAPWEFFRYQLIEFERSRSDLSLNDSITLLRQMSHEKNVPFDQVIGTSPGSIYLDTRPFVPGTWQLLKDYQQVVAPDGRIVDLHHLLVGLDILHRREGPVQFPYQTEYGVSVTVSVQNNWATATWAGDLGAGATDMTLAYDSIWERRHGQGLRLRAEYYFHSRAADWDLLADIDAWGIHLLRTRESRTVDDLLTPYYETIKDGRLTVARRAALERFLSHYGFTYQIQRDRKSYPVLVRQARPAGFVLRQIYDFARNWMSRRGYFNTAPNNIFANAMTTLFLFWLEYQAIDNSIEIN